MFEQLTPPAQDDAKQQLREGQKPEGTWRTWWRRNARWAVLLGPGLMVMLADTDAGSIITAAQSGAEWKYAMLLPQLLLIPVLYIVQEMTGRMGILTRKGHNELIRLHFGKGWALVSAGTLFMACLGALVTEFAGIAGVGELFHLPPAFTVPLITILLVWIGLSGTYARVERIGIAIGLLELSFLPAALLVHPDVTQVAQGLLQLPLTSHQQKIQGWLTRGKSRHPLSRLASQHFFT